MPGWFSLDNVLGILVTVLCGIIAHSIKTPKDSDRAQLLMALASDAAAVVHNLMPGAAWADLLQAVIARIVAGSSTPTRNTQVIATAAAAALVRLGHTQPQPNGRPAGK